MSVDSEVTNANACDVEKDGLILLEKSFSADAVVRTTARVAFWKYSGPGSASNPEKIFSKNEDGSETEEEKQYKYDVHMIGKLPMTLSAVEHVFRYCDHTEYEELGQAIFYSNLPTSVYENWLVTAREVLNSPTWTRVETVTFADKCATTYGVEPGSSMYGAADRFLTAWANRYPGWEYSDEALAAKEAVIAAQKAQEAATKEKAKKAAKEIERVAIQKAIEAEKLEVKKATLAAEEKDKAEKKAAIEKAALKAKNPPHGVACPAPFPGPMKTMYEISLRYQKRKQPAMTVGAVLAAMSACMHGRHALSDDLRGNLYVLGIAASGMGKDDLLGLVGDLAHIVGLPVESDIGSGAGLEESLRHSKSRRAVLVIDEVAHLIRGFSSAKAQDYAAVTGKFLLSLYSASKRMKATRALADDKKPRETMFHPYTVLLGMSTAEKMRGINSSLIEDGTLGRCLIFRGDDNAPLAEDEPEDYRYKALEKAVGELAIRVSDFTPVEFHENPAANPYAGHQDTIPMKHPNDGVRVYPLTPEARALEVDYGRACDHARESGDSITNVLRVRALEQAKRIALVLAAWDRSKTVSRAHLQWGIDLVSYSHACLLSFVETMTDSVVVRDAERILGYMQSAVTGKAPFYDKKANARAVESHEILHSPLLRKCKGMEATAFNKAIDHLESLGEITCSVQDRKAGQRGGPRGLYYTLAVPTESD